MFERKPGDSYVEGHDIKARMADALEEREKAMEARMSTVMGRYFEWLVRGGPSYRQSPEATKEAQYQGWVVSPALRRCCRIRKLAARAASAVGL